MESPEALSDEPLVKRVAQANLAAYDSEGSAAYIDGAPHLKHDQLRQLYASLLVGIFTAAKRHNPIPRVLDLGAGEGSVTLPLLELGAHVTAVDISPDQLATLRIKCARFGDRLTTRCEDITEMLNADDTRYDIVVANSFLHHIPNYMGLIRDLTYRLSEHGQFFSFQDPLLYSTQPRVGRLFDRIAYAAWRVTKKGAWLGFSRYWRRSRGLYLADSPHDNAEYHVLRDGVDHLAIRRLFTEQGFDCRVVKYFSTQSWFFQLLGTALSLHNTFAIIAVKNAATRRLG